MAFSPSQAGPSNAGQQNTYFTQALTPSSPPANAGTIPAFDIFEWYPLYQSCQRYFLDRAQHSEPVQAVAAFVNIALPYQRQPHPIPSSSLLTPTISPGGPLALGGGASYLSLVPYLRRLIACGLDFPGVLHGFFGDDWRRGVGPLHEQERRNYLFAAKSGGWAAVKKAYDGPRDGECVPFLKPLQGAAETELVAAEQSWSGWLAMEDWMVGPRAPDDTDMGGEGPVGGPVGPMGGNGGFAEQEQSPGGTGSSSAAFVP